MLEGELEKSANGHIVLLATCIVLSRTHLNCIHKQPWHGRGFNSKISDCTDLVTEAGESEHTYTDDLLQLSRCKRLGMAPLASQFCAIVTPLQVGAWAEALSSHPD